MHFIIIKNGFDDRIHDTKGQTWEALIVVNLFNELDLFTEIKLLDTRIVKNDPALGIVIYSAVCHPGYLTFPVELK